MAVAPGTRFGTYEIVAPLGSGGMGEVYRARDRNLRRDVAVKLLPGTLSADPDRIARFEREARAIAALSHPNILAIHDFGNQNGVRYAVTELLEGRTLRDVLRSGPLPLPKAIATAAQVARGLEAAHGRGIVHRDLKPDNLFVLNDGQIKILDFGLAKSAGGADPGSDPANTVTADATAAGVVLGTAGYMAPEQVRGQLVDHRADIFALGCVLYEMLSGRRAFSGDSAIDTLHATLHADPAGLDLLPVPEPLARIVSHALEKSPADRFQSAADLRLALEAIGGTAAVPASHTLPARRRVPVLAIALAAVLTAALAGGWWYWNAADSSPARSVTSQARGVAVLPFENLGAAEEAHFAAGVTEEVTLQLAKVSSLRVIGRAATSRYPAAAAQLPEMARELAVGAVLTGSIRQSGPQVRVTVQLLATPDGETIWSEQYDRTVANIFEAQSDIAIRVARALQVSLAPEERARLQRPPTDNTAAYELYEQQRRFSIGSREQNQEGIEILGNAIALDPQFAFAHAALARRLTSAGAMTGRRTDLVRAVEAAERAVQLDPFLSRAHHALGSALNRLGRVDEARIAMQRAIEVDANNASAMSDLSLYEATAGRLDQSVYWAMRMWPLLPNTPNSYYHVAIPLLFLDPSAAERWLAAAAARFRPDDPGAGERIPRMQAIAAMMRNDWTRAVALARDSVQARPGTTSSHHVLAEIATYAGAPDAVALVDRELERAPENPGAMHGVTPRTLRAYLYVRSGQSERAQPLLRAVLEINRKSNEAGDRRAWFETMGAHALLGEREEAIAAWQHLLDQGYYDARLDTYHPLVVSIKDDPRFVAGMDRLRRNVAAMRARVDLSPIDEWIARGAPVSTHP
jgi:non-specific serine/threonine protein kinase